MHEARGVRRVERIADLLEDVQDPDGLERTLPRHDRCEIGSVDEPHDDVEPTLRLTGIEDLDDARVLDRRRQTPFALEPLAELPVLCQMRRKKLQRPELPELLMPSPV